MITFACKEVKLEDLIKCAFFLNRTQYEVLMFLVKKQEKITATKIAKSMNMDRTTIQKAVKSLYQKELVKRRQLNLEKGGYTYVYQTKNKKEIKQRINQLVNGWTEKVRQRIDKW